MYNNIEKEKIKLLATDLDGTLLREDKTISEDDSETLRRLGRKGIVRVAATGRSLHKVRDVLHANSPFDFVIFSSGAGIYNWKEKQLIHSEKFENEITFEICKHLLKSNFNFFIYKPIPHNNLFWFHKGAGECHEFDSYLQRHSGDFTEFNLSNFSGEAGQVMAVIPNNDVLINRLTVNIYKACKNVRVIRTTSPVNTEFTWLEIFPDTVSKGHGLEWLCNYLKIERADTAGIGNDYNDIEMFEFVKYPFLMKNGAKQLKETVLTIEASNQENGLSQAVDLLGL